MNKKLLCMALTTSLTAFSASTYATPQGELEDACTRLSELTPQLMDAKNSGMSKEVVKGFSPNGNPLHNALVESIYSIDVSGDDINYLMGVYHGLSHLYKNFCIAYGKGL